jgi:hypothetical protein
LSQSWRGVVGVSVVSTIAHMTADSVSAASESPFLDGLLTSAAAVLCCVGLPQLTASPTGACSQSSSYCRHPPALEAHPTTGNLLLAISTARTEARRVRLCSAVGIARAAGFLTLRACDNTVTASGMQSCHIPGQPEQCHAGDRPFDIAVLIISINWRLARQEASFI